MTRRSFWLAAMCAAVVYGQPARDRHVIVVSLDGFPAYALNDPNVPLPVLRRLMREGGSAEGMRSINPTVTWPNHTSMVTGVGASGHGVLYNGMPYRAEGKPLRTEPWVDKKILVQAKTVYDAAHEAGLTTAEVDWVAIYQPGTVNWSFAEVPKPDGPLEKEMVAAGAITAQELEAFPRAPITYKDEMWMRAAVHIIEKHKPNLLLLHLLTTDSSQHQYGARSLGQASALVLADRQLQRVLDAVDRAGIRERTTLIVVSDHGFASYKKLIHGNALLRQKELVRGEGTSIDCDIWVVAEGGTAMVYVTRESKRAELEGLKEAFAKVPGVASVITPDAFARWGYPAWQSGGRMADLVLAAAPGYAFGTNSTGEVVTDVAAGANPGNHGYLNSEPDMTAILVTWGAGIAPGSRTGIVPNVNVAPTIARLLGLNFPTPATAVNELLKK